ncbi:F-box/kelch-repeat protein [Cardamine amara subsp. amara]|uniref:F-box/kelch-repeat protein n=1 Tax=Cardamine amara subsp. amara TaxID=228776 RepID=A0ABD1AMN4_CARAN
MAEPETEKNTSSMSLLDCSLLTVSVSKLHLSSPPSTATKEFKLSMPDWSLLPEELLNLISTSLENCFDVVHARSVCRSWRSTFPFPSCLLRPSYTLPTFVGYQSKDFCTLEKVPLFLFRVRAPEAASTIEYFLGGLGRDESDDHTELPSPIQCSVKVKIPGSDPTLMNMHDCQILPLGHQYRMIGCTSKDYRGVAVLPLNKDGSGKEFIVLLNYYKVLLVLRSTEMRWIRLPRLSSGTCSEIGTFRGKFYIAFLGQDIFIFDPYTLEVTPVRPLELLNCGSCIDLVPSGNDELFLVERIIPRTGDILYLTRLALRVNRLDEEAGKWVVVSEIGDRVLFINEMGNFSCSAKELPDDCGVNGNSILFTNRPGKLTFAYKYGVHTGNAEDDINCWRHSRDKHVTILNKSPMVAFRVER